MEKERKKYLFILGREPLLSTAELICFLKTSKRDFCIKTLGSGWAILEMEFESGLIGFLGGTQKIGLLAAGGNKEEITQCALNWVEKQGFGKKALIGISDYSDSRIGKRIRKKCLEFFKKNRVKAKIMMPKKIEGDEKSHLSPTQTISLLKRNGAELLLVEKGKEFFLAETIECFDPKFFQEIEKSIPQKDFLSQTSRRLAKIMLNLSCAEKNSTILDPFCGKGTILQTAMLNGINAIGLDAKTRETEDCDENLQWLKQEFGIKNDFRVITGKAENIDNHVSGKQFNAIVSEPYMGQFLKKIPGKQEAKKIFDELETLFQGFFSSASRVIGKQRIVVILPEVPFVEKGRIGYFKVSEKLFLEKGFASINPIAEIQSNAFPFVLKKGKGKLKRKLFVLQKTNY